MRALLVCLGLLGLCACEAEERSTCLIERRGAGGEVSRVSGECAGKDFSGVDLSGADVSGVDWAGVTCPDGSASADHGGTCAGHLRPAPDAGPDAMEPELPPEDLGDGIDLVHDAPPDIDPVDTPDADFAPDEEPSPLDLPPDEGSAPDLPLEDMAPDEEEPVDPPIRRGCEGEGELNCFDRCLWLGAEDAVSAITLPGLARPWTWEVWVYLYALPAEGYAPIFTWGLPSPPDGRPGWGLGVRRVSEGVGEVVAQLGDEQIIRHAGARLRVGRWHHLTLDSTSRVFVDGEPAEGGFEGRPIDWSQVILGGLFHLGHFADGPRLDGVLRELRANRRLRYERAFEPPVRLREEELTSYLWSLGDDGRLLRDVVNLHDIPVTPSAWRACPL